MDEDNLKLLFLDVFAFSREFFEYCQPFLSVLGGPWNQFGNFQQMFKLLKIFDRGKFEMVMFHRQSKKCTRKCKKMSKNHKFGSLEILNLHQILHRCVIPCKFSLENNLRCYLIFSPKHLPDNAKNVKNNNLQSFWSKFRGP